MKKIIAFVVTLVMLTAMWIPFAPAASAAKAVTMTMSLFGNPENFPQFNLNDPDTVIYYGGTSFRLVGSDTAYSLVWNATPAGTWMLLAADTLATDVQFDPKGKSNGYYDSALRAAVESSVKLTDSEKQSIVPRSMTNSGDGIADAVVPNLLLWEPTAKEVSQIRIEYRKASEWWWLSSAGINNVSGGFVSADGEVIGDGHFVGEKGGVRPALYVDHTNILFMSAAVGGKSTVPVGGKAVTGLQTSGSGWKLTIKDIAHRNFAASTAMTQTETTISYRNAVTGPNEYISYYVTDAGGSIVYYGRACAVTSSNGTVTVPTPQLQNGCTLYVINEQINGDYLTDYASEPQEATARIPDGDYVIYSAENGAYCLDIAGGANARSNGDNLQLWKASDSGAKVFTLTYDAGSGGYIITAKHSGLVLDVSGAQVGGNIHQWQSNGGWHQRWVFTPMGDGTYRIAAKNGGYMRVDGSPANGTNISTDVLFPSKFRLVPVSSFEPEEGSYIIYSRLGNDMCLDVAGGVDARSPGDDVWLWNAKSSTAKTYNIIKDPETDSFKIVAAHSGLLLTEESSHSKGYANVYQDREFTDSNKYRQRWVFEAYDNGCYFIRSLNWGYLNVANAQAQNGASVIAFDYQLGNHEIFRLDKIADLPIEDGDYIIYSALNDGKCFDIAGGTNALSNGDQLQLWDASSSGAKVFSIKYDEETDAYIIKAKQSGLVLDVSGGSTKEGTKVWQWEDLGAPNQRWRFEKASDGYYYIRAVQGLYLDVTEGKTANGTKIISFRFQEGAKNQMFRLERIPVRPLEDGEYVFYSALDDTKCLEIEGNHSTAIGARVQLMSASFSNEKTFSVKYDEKTDAYIIHATYTNRVLDVEGGSTADGMKVQQWEDLGYDVLKQRWRFEQAEDGYYYIHAVQGLYMDVAEGKNGTYVLSRNFREGSPNQMFKPVKVSTDTLKISTDTLKTGSVLSGGSLWIVIGAAALAVVGTTALLVVRKKRAGNREQEAGNGEQSTES